MNIDDRLDRLTGVVESLAGSVVEHDSRIVALIQVAEKHAEATANLEKQWQAYINTLPRQ
jgi:hypothetical protein